MQGLADGYFVAPYTIGDYLAGLLGQTPVSTDDPVFKAGRGGHQRRDQALAAPSAAPSPRSTTTGSSASSSGTTAAWPASKNGLEKALSEIPALREEFEKNVRVLGNDEGVNQSLEKVGRVADFFELGELMCRDALMREESCGGHFRVEHQTDEGEAQRDDENFSFVGAWEYTGEGQHPQPPQEHLVFEFVKPSVRSYK